MSRVAVVDLARELEIRAADLIYLADEAGVHIARIGATISESQAQNIRNVAATMHVTRDGGRRIVRPKTPKTLPRPDEQAAGLTHSIGSHRTEVAP